MQKIVKIHSYLFERGYMQTAKREVAALLDRLPEDCSLEDIQYHLYVLEKIRRGLTSVEKGETLTQEEVERRLDKWLLK